jgi:hypothetical protein
MNRINCNLGDARTKLQKAQLTLDPGYYKLLCALLDHAPSPQGVENIAHDIVSCKPEHLVDLAKLYIHGILIPSEHSIPVQFV